MSLLQSIFRLLTGNKRFIRLRNNSYQFDNTLGCTISYNQYGGYCIPLSSSHRPAAQKILSNKVYEPKTIEFIRLNCGSDDVIHAGAYFGDFLPAISKGLNNESMLYAFEPNLENYRCALITLTLNNIGIISAQELE